MNNLIILELVSVSMIASAISMLLIQKIKTLFKFSKTFNNIISLIFSFWFGFMYSYCFNSYSILCAFWVGLFTLIGADKLYELLKKDIDNVNKK